MAEAKNTFIKSRMNKDLDARLIPNGEYREAFNVTISKSEGEGVGSLENILGNIYKTNFGFDIGNSDTSTYGVYRTFLLMKLIIELYYF